MLRHRSQITAIKLGTVEYSASTAYQKVLLTLEPRSNVFFCTLFGIFLLINT